MKEYIFIVNPIAGGGRALKAIPLIEGSCKENRLSFQIILTEYTKHGTEISSQFRDKDKVVVAVGGDGTVNETLSGLVGSEAVLGILPFGSGNDIGSSFHITPKNALDVILQGYSKRFDVGKVNDKFFMGVASCGFDTEVNRTANRIPRFIKDAPLYVLSILITLISYQCKKLTIEFLDQIIEKEIMLLAVGHGDRYGGGMKITPNADREDGLFDLCLVSKVSKFELIRLIPKVFKGTHITHPKVSNYKVPYLTIRGEGLVYADGEYKTELPATYSIVPKAVNLLVPVPIDVPDTNNNP